MLKTYTILLFLLGLCCFPLVGNAQQTPEIKPHTIAGLSIYPNPVTNYTSTINITSKHNSLKRVSIYDVLGNRVTNSVNTTKALNISALSPGVYILEISDGTASESRKLIIR